MEINWESKVLSSVLKVIPRLSFLEIDEEKINEVAKQLAHEDFLTSYQGDKEIEPREYMRKILFINTLNFAFTDFFTPVKYQYKQLSDTDAMVYQIDEAIQKGVPLLKGHYMRDINIDEFRKLFTGNIEMPMLKEKVEILNEVGNTLVSKYDGDWINFIEAGPKKLYANGEGLVERLITDFQRFDDFSIYENEKIYFLKLAQLAFWGIHRELSSTYFYIEDMENMTAFADYIIPVALQTFGVTKYTSELEKKITDGVLLERDSKEEIEIRAATIYATAKMTESINELINRKEKIIIPQLDFKLWTEFHAENTPHHLTKTIMY